MFKVRRFKELTVDELYKILALRSEVFVVEQKCVYNDIDGKDLKSTHMWIQENGKIVAYIRIVDRGVSYDEASIGRVLVPIDERGRGLAKKIIREGIKYLTEISSEKKITIGAQHYLKNFYQDLGFVEISDIYDEDGIPHLDMQYNCELF